MRQTVCIAILLSGLSGPAMAEFDGPRVYWPLPKNYNIISTARFDGRANFNTNIIGQYPGTIDVAPDLWTATYVRSQPVFGRTTYWQATLPFGSLDTDSSVPLPATNQFADGVGDLQLGGVINVVGAPELAVRDLLRFDEPFLLYAGVHATLPTSTWLGSYDENEALNVGGNRYNVRLSAPAVFQLGDWVPGRRLTLEVMPAVRLFGENSNTLGESMQQDPVYSVEAHLTKDVTKRAFVSLDYTYLNGGEQSFTHLTTGATRSSPGIDAHFLGATIGFNVNDNLSINLSHMQAIAGDVGGLDVETSITKLQFTWAWHDVLERRSDF